MRHNTIHTADQQAIRKSRAENSKEPRLSKLDYAIQHAVDALLGLQHPDGYWCFELEADCTIPAEYILMMHYLAELDGQMERKLATYLRAHQGDDGGWPL